MMRIIGNILLVMCASIACVGFISERRDTLPIKEGYVRTNGAKLYYKAVGKGDPIIILHGGPGLNQSYFFPHFNKLAEKHQLIFYDQRGCGKSSDSVAAETISLENYIKDIDALMETFHIKKVTLLSHSFGGVFASNYAFTHPDKVKKLVLVNSVPFNKEFEKQIGLLNKNKQLPIDSIERAEIIASTDFKDGKVAAFENLFNVVFRSSFFNRSYSDSLHLKLEENFGENRKKLNNLSKDLTKFDFYADLKKVKCPVIVIYGKSDAIPIEAYTKMAENLKTCKLVGIDNAGHYPFIEQKSIFFKILERNL